MAVRKLEDQSQKGKSFDRPRTFKSIKYLIFLGEMMFGPNIWMSGSQFRSVVWSLIIFYLNSVFSILLIGESQVQLGFDHLETFQI